MPRKVVNGTVNVSNVKKRKQKRKRKAKPKPQPSPYKLDAPPFYKKESSGMPAAFVSKTRSRMRTSKSTNGLRVTGYDLVYKLSPDDTLIDGAFVAIPANPAYWTGTRIAQLATAYSQYRPIYLRFDYFPVVGTSTNGAITSGTFWNQSVVEESLTQALVTSNGGISHPCYTKNRSVVRLKSNLEQNLFSMDGNLKGDTNPFIFLAATTGVNGIIPGYYMAAYTYELKNPIGDGNEYDTFVTTAGQLTEEDIWEHTSAVVMSETNVGMGPGTILAVEIIGAVVLNTIQFFLKGSQAGVLADTVLKIFRNRNRTKTREEHNNNGSFSMQYINSIDYHNATPDGRLILPVGQDDDNNPFINVNTDQFSNDFSNFQVNCKGWVFKFNQTQRVLDVYWVEQPLTAEEQLEYMRLATIGYILSTETQVPVTSVSHQITPGTYMLLNMTQQTPNGIEAAEVKLEIGDTHMVAVASLPACALEPMIRLPEAPIVVGRGRVIGNMPKTYVNRILVQSNLKQKQQTQIERAKEIRRRTNQIPNRA